MQPLINLKQFLAVLVLLIVPAVLLTAYFRNFQPESGGHQSGNASGHHATASQSAASGEQAKTGGGAMDHSKMPGMKDGNMEGMDHSKMPEKSDTKGEAMPAMKQGAAEGEAAQPADANQLEASRAQLEASRLQLEASRKALEATSNLPTSGTQKSESDNPPSTATPPAKPATDGHAHKH